MYTLSGDHLSGAGFTRCALATRRRAPYTLSAVSCNEISERDKHGPGDFTSLDLLKPRAYIVPAPDSFSNRVADSARARRSVKSGRRLNLLKISAVREFTTAR